MGDGVLVLATLVASAPVEWLLSAATMLLRVYRVCVLCGNSLLFKLHTRVLNDLCQLIYYWKLFYNLVHIELRP